MLSVRDILFRYPGFELETSFEVGKGDTMALMGPSGCGKTTVLNLVAGFLNPLNGDIRVDGKSIIGLKPSQRPLTYLFQSNNLFPHLTVWQNLAIGLHPGMKLDDSQKQAVETVLDKLSLQDFGKRYPGDLSGGQQQRVALGRCLLRKRPLLLLDEPFSALDDALRMEIIDLVRQLQRSLQLTLLLSTHHRDDADRLDARIYRMAPGSTKNSSSQDPLPS
jgi:thiamine transport system ATP-binding protein